MSSILKGLNESAYRQYDTNRTGFSRGTRDDERHDLDVQQPSKQEWALKINGKVWSKDGNTVTFDSKEKALKARQSLLARRPELEVGLVTRGGVAEADVEESHYDIGDFHNAKLSGDYGKGLTTSGISSSGHSIDKGANDGQRGRPSHNKLVGVSKALPADPFNRTSGKIPRGIKGKVHSLMGPDDQLDEISNEKLAQYKTAAAADAKKADSEGDYKRGDKRFSGIVKATKKQFANDEKNVEETKLATMRKYYAGDKNAKDPTKLSQMRDYFSKIDSSKLDKNSKIGSTIRHLDKKQAEKQAVAEDELDENCWKGYHKEGNKELFGKTVPNCVKNEDVAEGANAGDIELSHSMSPDMLYVHATSDGTDVGGARFKKIDGAWTGDIVHVYPQFRRQGIATKIYDYAEDLVGKIIPSKTLKPKGKKFWDNRDKQGVAEEQHSCPHCGGEMVSEELMNEKKDACYYKVKSRYKVWPSAYASGALVKCRKKGADSWGNGGKKNESSILEGIEQVDENLHKWFKEKWVRFGPDGKIRGDCARGDDSEGKPKCLPQSKAHSLGKKGRASAASRKRREDPNPERSGKAINVNTKKKSDESIDEGWRDKLGAAALAGSMALGASGAHARVTPGDDPNINRLNGQPIATQQSTTAPAKAEAPKGFSKEYLQSVIDGKHPRPMISIEKAQELLKQMNEDQLDEKWSQKYKDSINCSNPKGFSQKAHCQGKNK
jgi:GNAT superfamily N-acetyltransferase